MENRSELNHQPWFDLEKLHIFMNRTIDDLLLPRFSGEKEEKIERIGGSECLEWKTKDTAVCLSAGAALMLTDWRQTGIQLPKQLPGYVGACVCSGKLTWMHQNPQETRGGFEPPYRPKHSN